MAKLESTNPVDGSVVGSVEETLVSEIDSLILRARAAQRAWAARPIEERAELVSRAGGILADRADEVSTLLTREMGKPLMEAQGEVKYAAKTFGERADEVVAALAPEVKENERVRSTIYRDAFGVTACISPWNFPVLMPHDQIIPALVAGNAVLFKPSELTPLVGQAYADALLEVLPEDVLQVVHGADEQGKALVRGDVDLIVFTGSRNAGQHILAEASRGLKRVILELGGKDPLVVLDDADVAAAAKFAARNSFRNAGQVCVSTERIYVQPSAHDAFVESLVAGAAKMKLGDGLEEGTRVGPMVDERQKAHVQRQVEDAVDKGATVAFRGDDRGGNFFAPVVLTGVTPEMDIMREETFGPVACVMRVDGDDDAVREANDTPYGLGAVVFGEPDHARGVARRLTAGMIGVNQGLSSAGSTPWVGARQSGYGFHTGTDGHRQFAQVRVVHEAKG
jgi:acyl-CoA reductase-like NAD-dependent aldehyde dehydrogenase